MSNIIPNYAESRIIGRDFLCRTHLHPFRGKCPAGPRQLGGTSHIAICDGVGDGMRRQDGRDCGEEEKSRKLVRPFFWKMDGAFSAGGRNCPENYAGEV